jgi:hypothetical protein
MKRIFETTNNRDAERCKEAFRMGKRVTVTGVDTLTKETREYVGHVLSVQYASGNPWLIGIDAD